MKPVTMTLNVQNVSRKFSRLFKIDQTYANFSFDFTQFRAMFFYERMSTGFSRWVLATVNSLLFFILTILLVGEGEIHDQIKQGKSHRGKGSARFGEVSSFRVRARDALSSRWPLWVCRVALSGRVVDFGGVRYSDRLGREVEGLYGSTKALITIGPPRVRGRNACVVPFIRYGERQRAFWWGMDPEGKVSATHQLRTHCALTEPLWPCIQRALSPTVLPFASSGLYHQ